MTDPNVNPSLKHPLAFDANGDPMHLPADAVAWRVRRGGGRRGRPRSLFDESGRQLELQLTATVEDLVEAGCSPGRYRLEAVDAEGRVIPGFVAVTEVPASDEPEVYGEPSDASPRLMELCADLARANAQAMVAMATAGYGMHRPVISMPSEPPPTMPAPAAQGPSAQDAMLMQMFSTAMDYLKNQATKKPEAQPAEAAAS